MNCCQHADQVAVGVCRACGRGMCKGCAEGSTGWLACRAECRAHNAAEKSGLASLRESEASQRRAVAWIGVFMMAVGCLLITWGVVEWRQGFSPVVLVLFGGTLALAGMLILVGQRNRGGLPEEADDLD